MEVTTDVRSGIDAVCAVARADAVAGAEAGRLTDRVVDIVRQARLFKLYLPAELGGLSLGLPDACAVIAEVAEADGAAGWAVMIGAGPNWFAGRMSAPLAEEVFAAPDSVVAGSGTPGRAVRADGGWTVRGRWRWCSGASWATWFTFTAAPESGGPPFALAVPADAVRLHPETWDVRGLRATASWDAELDGVLVPDARTFRTDGPLTRSEPVFAVPFPAFAQATMAAVSVGLARRLVTELGVLVAEKTPTMGPRPLREDPVTLDALARLTASTRSAARYLEAATAAVWATCAEGREPGSAALTDLQLAAGLAASEGARAGSEAWSLAGMTVLDRTSTLGRVVADLQAASQNAVVSAARFADAGAALLAP